LRSAWLVLALFFIATGLPAQSTGKSAEGAQKAAQASAQNSDLQTLTGCVGTTRESYTLTESDGTTHQLAGAANKLRHEVGRRVELGGKDGTRTIDSTAAGMASSAIEQRVFEVKTIKRIADTCKDTE